MKYFLVLVIVFSVLVSSAAKAQQGEAAIRSAIQSQVSQRHPSIPPGFWEGLGSEAVPVIKKMYIQSTKPNERGILIDGLAHFSESSSTSFLRGEASSEQDEVMRKKLVSAVIQAEGEGSFEFVEPFLKDADPHVRLAVAQGLKSFEANERIQKRLAEFRSSEKTSWVVADFNKKAPAEDLRRIRGAGGKNAPKVVASKASTTASSVKALPALPEKSWAGVWRGSMVTESKVILVEANLVLVDAATSPMKWKVEYKLPKQVKQEWKSGEFTLHYFQTNRAHWIEARNSKQDTVFLAQRKAQ